MVTKHNHFSIKTNPGKIDFNIRSVALVKRVKQNNFPDFQYLHSVRLICNLLQRFENSKLSKLVSSSFYNWFSLSLNQLLSVSNLFYTWRRSFNPFSIYWETHYWKLIVWHAKNFVFKLEQSTSNWKVSYLKVFSARYILVFIFNV